LKCGGEDVPLTISWLPDLTNVRDVAHCLQWLFVLEGFPSVVMGVVVLCVLPDSYKTAPWLSESEKALLAADVSAEPTVLKSFGVLLLSLR
jgi:hypothetical protein